MLSHAVQMTSPRAKICDLREISYRKSAEPFPSGSDACIRTVFEKSRSRPFL